MTHPDLTDRVLHDAVVLDLLARRPGVHPSGCRDPHCTLTYRDHLLSVGFSAAATPTRRPETARSLVREQRWAKDIPAFKRLHAEGVSPPHIDGSALRERQGETVYDVTARPVDVDYTSAK